MPKPDDEGFHPAKVGPVAQALALSRLIVVHPGLRRQAMIGALLLAAAQCFGGSVVFPNQLEERPTLFVLYWAACFLFVLIAVGLSLLDLLKLRGQMNSELRKLKESLDEAEPSEDEGEGMGG